MNTQELFNKVIDGGHYPTNTPASMCEAVRSARLRRTITKEEEQHLHRVIGSYLSRSNCMYLKTALELSGLPSTIEARTAIYRDWDSRPTLKEHTDD